MSIFKSFSNALRGVCLVFREERSFRLQTAAAVLVIVLMFIFNITLVEKSLLLLLMVLVLILEMMNSIMERFVDVLKPRIHTYVKDMKDIAAGAVLISSLGAAAVGIIIFYPHIYDLIKNCSWLRI